MSSSFILDLDIFLCFIIKFRTNFKYQTNLMISEIPPYKNSDIRMKFILQKTFFPFIHFIFAFKWTFYMTKLVDSKLFSIIWLIFRIPFAKTFRWRNRDEMNETNDTENVWTPIFEWRLKLEWNTWMRAPVRSYSQMECFQIGTMRARCHTLI